MLEAIDLSKSYDGRFALKGLNLRIAPGEVFCLLGANGAGKTTTIHLFLGFTPRSGGLARVDGLDVVAHPLETKRRLAYVPEQLALYPRLSGLENLEYFASLALDTRPRRGEYAAYRVASRLQRRGELLALLSRVGLPAPAAERRVSTYSKGMRQKVGIAIALAKKAKALLMDEPTSGLDPSAGNELSELVRALSSEGVAVLMATHDLFRAQSTGTRVGIMREGELVADLSTTGLATAELERIYLAEAASSAIRRAS